MAHKPREAAVMCWFPTEGDPLPISMKFKDDEDEIISVKNIRIKTTNDILQGKEYRCEAIISGIMYGFSLTFYTRDCRWLLHFK